VIQAVLPTMRQQGDGRIVNISSVAGLIPLPYRGIYGASKHALEGYTEALDHEIRQFGIRALLVEPSFTKTDIESRGRTASTVLGAYAEQKQRVTEIILRRVAQGDDPRAVAEVVYRALTAEAPHLRYPVGGGVALTRLRRFVPDRMFDKTFSKQFQLDEPVRR
jgi:short-subunit dehydrogenase